MLAERLLTPFLRFELGRCLRLVPSQLPMLPAPNPGRDYLLYVHIPFCEQLCPYCSFNRFPFREDRARAYFEQLRREMRMVSGLGYDFSAMYIGGGTPTVLPDELCLTIDLARDLFGIKEVSCETNPNHLTSGIIDMLEGRVQRLSVGVQSFDDDLLQQMQRYHKYGSGDQILRSLEWATGHFNTLNVDMIFNFPSQTELVLMEDVRKIIQSGVTQTTFYALMASPVVANSMKNSVGKVDYRREGLYYSILSERLSQSFRPVSSWCFSRLGAEMIDEYIVDYEEYLGIGSGAFSYLDGTLYVNTFSLKDYGELISDDRMSVSQKRVFSRKEQMRYRFMMDLFGLRLDKTKFRERFGVSVDQALRLEMLFMRLARGLATSDDMALTLTPRGRYLLVVMMREFFVAVNSVRDQARSALSPDEIEELFTSLE